MVCQELLQLEFPVAGKVKEAEYLWVVLAAAQRKRHRVHLTLNLILVAVEAVALAVALVVVVGKDQEVVLEVSLVLDLKDVNLELDHTQELLGVMEAQLQQDL